MKKLLSICFLSTICVVNTAVAADNTTSVVNGLNEFSFNLYRQVSKPDANITVSPYSISSLLGRLVSGADGKTRQQMLQVLKVKDVANMNVALSNLDTTLIKDSGCTTQMDCNKKQSSDFLLANAFWTDKTISYKKPFLVSMQQDKTINFYTVDFIHDKSGAENSINEWVKHSTKGYIDKLFPPGVIDPQSTRLILTNAIYFKGKWQLPFKSQDTQQKDFTLPNGSKKPVPMMMQESNFVYAENKQLQMLQLKYANSSFAMAVLLPKPGYSLVTLQKTLSEKTFSDLLKASHEKNVQVSLPKFTIDTTLASLADAMKKMGMTEAFSSQADFSKISDMPLGISDIVQKAIVQVDEEGTIAAAASAVTMFGTAAPESPVMFNANHGFLFVIYDANSRAVLFVGQVVNPVAD